MTKKLTRLRGSSLLWTYQEHWSGEIAEFETCGLRVYVRDMDGDGSYWIIQKGRGGPEIARGDLRHTHDDFRECACEAEEALRDIIERRIAQLRAQRTEVVS